MNEPRQETLARPGLPLDEHGRQSARVLLPGQDPLDLLPNRLDARALTEEIGQVFHGSSILLAGQYGVQLLTSFGAAIHHLYQ
jgi:hypothetical protein